MTDHKRINDRLLVYFVVLTLLFFNSTSGGRRSPLFTFTKSSYVATIPENARGKVYANADSKMGVYVPYFSSTTSDFDASSSSNDDGSSKNNAENSVRYKIVSGDKQNFFKAEHEFVGNFVFLRIRTRPSLDLSLNRELTPEFALRIKATLKRPNERNLETWTEVLIKVLDQNDLAPLFMPDFQSVEINEDLPLFSTVTQVLATDPDDGLNGEIYYSLPERNKYFVVNPNTGVISLVKKLSSDTERNFSLKILAEDRASRLFPDQKSAKLPSFATVNITVKSVNLNAPTLIVVENETISNVINLCGVGPSLRTCALLKAADLDNEKHGKIKKVEILSGDYDHWFVINRASEDFYEIRSLGDVPNGVYHLHIGVEDDGYPSKKSTTQVTVKVTETCPELKSSVIHYKFTVDECSAQGTIVGFVGGADDENFLRSGDFLWKTKSPGPFKINPKNGLLTVVNGLNFAANSKYRLDVVATNERCSQTIEFQAEIDVNDCNDHIPTFDDVSCSNIWIQPQTVIESVLCTVKASDLDVGLNGKISYSLHADNKNLSKLFWIDSFNGVLKLSSPVTVEYANKEVTFKIRASDWGVPYRLESELSVFAWFGSESKPETNVKPIISTPDNRFEPKFDDDQSAVFYVSENASVGSIVFAIKATDDDFGAAGFVRYAIIGGNEDGFWTIESDSGDVRPLRNLDREKLSKFSLLVEAVDSGRPFKFARKNISIELTDYNDDKPKFVQQFYVVKVSEDAKIGSTIARLKATDDDEGENARVSYFLIPESSIFAIETDSGALVLKQTLDREIRTEYKLTVNAIDHGSPSLSSTTLVKIVVDDVNDNAPECYLKNQKFQLAEDLPVNSLITCVDSYDPDLGPGGRVAYRLSETRDPFNLPKAASKFAIESDSGCIWLQAKLDFEERPIFNLSVELTDAGQPQFTTFCNLLIEVVNVNENRFPPLFENFAVESSVYENEPEYTLVTEVRAKDPDQLPNEGVITYSIVGGDGLGFFSVDGTGKIRTGRKLDRETKPYYWLTVVARDHGVVPLSSSVEVFVRVLDRNDNGPIPVSPWFGGSIKENSPANSIVVRVEAYDRDADDEEAESLLTYKINQGDPQSFFKIDSKTGYISTDKRQLDRESVESFELEVAVVDDGVPPLSSLVTVFITVDDENDCPPKFLNRFNEFQIAATVDQPKETFLCRIYAVDFDSESVSPLRYNISEGNEDGRLWIDPLTGEIYSSAKLIERETIALTISVFDGKFHDDTSVVFNVIARPNVQNNKPPVLNSFQNASIHVSANEPLGRSIGLLEANDPDGDSLWFYLDDGNYGDVFSLKPDSGDLQLAKKPNSSVYHLTYIVTDSLHSVFGKASVFVENISDKKIAFQKESYTVDVFENITIGGVIFQLASEVRDADVDARYFLTSDFSSGSSKFEIDPRSGNIFLTDHLDRETTKSYVLMVEARNKRQKTFTLIHVEVIDVNDHKPKFVSSYNELRIQETVLVDSVLAHLLAIDEDAGDAGRLTYKIVGGNDLGFFAIDPQSGHVKIAKQLQSKYPEFVLSIKVEDGGQPSQSDSTTLRILLSASIQSYVKFQNDVYTVQLPENQRSGTVIGNVAVEAGASVTYSLEDSTGLFEINPTSGVVYLIGALDFESNKHLEMLVSAKGFTGGEDVARFVVKVSDSNDHSPVFKQHIYEGVVFENAPSGTIVVSKGFSDVPLTVLATDTDTGPAGLVSYRISDAWAQNYFEIDYRTGSIRTKLQMDFEKRKLYEFFVMAEDMGEPKMHSLTPTLIRVTIENVNDNAPKFEKSEYNAIVYLPTANDAAVVQTKAKDADDLDILKYSSSNYRNIYFIDETSGVLKIRNASALTIGQSHDVIVSVSDGTFFTQTKIKTETKYRRSHEDFHFVSDVYTVNVLENVSTRQTILVLQTFGSTLGETVVFSLLNENKWFTLNPFTGLLETTGVPLDREEHHKGRLNLIVHAHDQRNSPRLAHCVVDINIEDQNDSPPIFIGAPYEIAIPMETAQKISIAKLKAVDLDDGDNGRVGFKFGRLTDDAREFVDNYLILNESSGELSLKRNFTDGTGQGQYLLPIVAFDYGVPPLSSVSTMKINIVNKDTPIFSQPYFNVSVPEGIASVGKTLLKLNATSTNGNLLGYRIISGDGDSLFWIKFLTGELIAQKPLDRENLAMHHLKLQAVDIFTNAISEIMVNVEILDVNDNPPTFDRRIYSLDVKENSLPGSKIGHVQAFDADIGDNARLTYSLYSEIVKFEINKDSGDLILVSPIDFESTRQYAFDVKVKDSGLPSLSSTAKVKINILDVNDNAPVFTQLAYESVLTRNCPLDSFVAQISAYDEDQIDRSRLIYSIFDGDDEQLFALDSHSGVVKTAKLLTNALKSKYLLNLTVSDGLYSSSCLLSTKLELKSSTNVFVKRTFDASVKESAEIGNLVGSLDVQSPSPLTYRLLNGGFPFRIDSSTGNVYVNERLDAERKKFYAITILAEDAIGTTHAAQMKISVIDVNDNKPKFAANNYKTSFPFDASVGTTVLQVFADDADENDAPEYSIRKDTDGDVAEKYFKLNGQNGKLETRRDLKDLSGRQIRFVIIATDQGNPPLHDEVPVEIDFSSNKNNWVQFSENEYSFKVSENADVGTKIGRVRLSSLSKSTFGILPAVGDDGLLTEFPFEIDENGTISLVKLVDRELRSKYSFHIGAALQAGAKYNSLALVHVKIDDVNDNMPKFFAPQLQLNVLEDSPVGTSVVILSADDADVDSSATVKYTIGNSPDKDFFKVDPYSGWILTNQPLDRETKDLLLVKIIAADDGQPSKSSDILLEIRILDVNDVAPKFEKEAYEFSVNENASPGTVVGQVRVNDNDLPPFNASSFYIVDGNLEGLFGVHMNGQVYVARALDYEMAQVHRLVVLVSDGKFSDTALILITLNDQDDSAPVCDRDFVSINIMENSDVGSSIYVVEASELDSMEGTILKYSLIGSKDFYIASDGKITIHRNLDREKTPKYELVAKVEDSGDRFCETHLSINITDTNDEPPIFDQKFYRSDVTENYDGKFPQFVLQVQALDNDIGDGSQVKFHFGDEVDKTKFSIDSKSGAVFALKSLDREEIDSYNLTIIAEDSGNPSRLSASYILINILDVNDNPPEFLQKVYVVNVEEDTPVDVEVLRVKAISKDSGNNAEIHYKLLKKSDDDAFVLDEISGALTVKKVLDFEKTTEYSFIVVGTDGGETPLSGSSTINIFIKDVNDNAPIFTQEIYRTKVFENETVGAKLMQVIAHDKDSGDNGKVSYELVESRKNEANLFRLTPDGRLELISSLDYETKKSHLLEVKTFDNGSPQMSAVAQIQIDVVDINDNAPQIANCNRTIVVKQHSKIDTSVHVLNANDLDGDGNGAPFSYQLFGKGSNDFRILPSGHLHTTVSPLNELQYKLKVVATDTGKPSLTSECHLFIKITEESRFAPEVSSFQTVLMTYLGEFHGGLVGKVAAHDRDAQDHLIYGIQTLDDEHREFFDVHPEDGRVSAAAGLKPGEYVFNVTAFDGSFLTSATSTIAAKVITTEMLTASVSVKLSGLDIHSFVHSKMNLFSRTAANLLGVRPQFVHLLSVQSSSTVQRSVDVLFAVRKSRQEFHKPSYVRATLAGKLEEFSDVLKISELVTEICRKGSCVRGDCRDILTLDEVNMVAVVSEKLNFVSPKHLRSSECICYEGFGGATCDKTINSCGSSPCPNEQICVPDDSADGYHCTCPPGRHGTDCRQLSCTQLPCPDSALNFVGKSFVRYTLSESLETEMDFNLQFRTTSPFGTLMFASGKTDFQLLEVHGGLVQYRFDLGSGENIVRVSQLTVSDGQWHTVRVYRSEKHASLTLDKKFTSKFDAVGASNVLNLHGAHLYLGAEVISDISSVPTIRSGFTGCIQTAELNGYRLPLNGPGVLLHNVRFECQLDMLVGACRNSPCRNGGSCSIKGSSYVCGCPSRFSGRHCEIDTEPCKSKPCENDATCENLYNDFLCKCPQGIFGKTCNEVTDADACTSLPCANGGLCVAVPNGYLCNCSIGWTGPLCTNELTVPNISSSVWGGVTWPELIGIVVLLLVLIILTIVIVFLCRKRHRYRYKKANYIQNVPTDEISRDILQPFPGACNTSSNPSLFPRTTGGKSAPPPLPPRMRSFVPHRGSKLSNLESALQTGIPTVQVRPLSMSERQATPPPPNLLESAANYGSAAEELERLGRGPEADVEDNVDDWKAALQLVNFNDDSLERLKAVATSLESPATRPKRRVNAVNPLGAPSVTSIQCLPEDEQMSAYHWDYSDWNSTLGQPGGYNTLSRSEIATDDETGAVTTDSLPRGVSKLEETDTESVGDINHEGDNELNELEEAAAGMDEFRQQLLALSKLNRRLDANDEYNPPVSKGHGKGGGSYLDRYLPRLQVPSSTGSERRRLLDPNDNNKGLLNNRRGADAETSDDYESEWSLPMADDDQMQTSMEGHMSSTNALDSTNDISAVCEIEDDCVSNVSSRLGNRGRMDSDERISPASIKKQTEV